MTVAPLWASVPTKVGNPRDIVHCPAPTSTTFIKDQILLGIKDWCGMGRSLAVGRKSENLPVVSYPYTGFPFFHSLENGDPCSRDLGQGVEFAFGRAYQKQRAERSFELTALKNRRSFRGNGGFFIGSARPRDKDAKRRKEVNRAYNEQRLAYSLNRFAIF